MYVSVKYLLHLNHATSVELVWKNLRHLNRKEIKFLFFACSNIKTPTKNGYFYISAIKSSVACVIFSMVCWTFVENLACDWLNLEAKTFARQMNNDTKTNISQLLLFNLDETHRKQYKFCVIWLNISHDWIKENNKKIIYTNKTLFFITRKSSFEIAKACYIQKSYSL